MDSDYLWILAAIIFIVVLLKFGGNAQTPLSSATESDIQNALNDGNKILSIKYYRVINDCSLTEAKQAVDKMSKQP